MIGTVEEQALSLSCGFCGALRFSSGTLPILSANMLAPVTRCDRQHLSAVVFLLATGTQPSAVQPLAKIASPNTKLIRCVKTRPLASGNHALGTILSVPAAGAKMTGRFFEIQRKFTQRTQRGIASSKVITGNTNRSSRISRIRRTAAALSNSSPTAWFTAYTSILKAGSGTMTHAKILP
jgi:hypothetical protein